MHESTSPRRKGVKLLALFGTLGAGLVSAGALIASVSPAQAASIASQPDTQVAVFMVPLTLLVLVLMFEVARFAWRGKLPAEAPARRSRPTDWARSRVQK